MKQSTRRLTLRKQTLRHLAIHELTRANGGNEESVVVTTVLRTHQCTAWQCQTLVTCPPTGCVQA